MKKKIVTAWLLVNSDYRYYISIAITLFFVGCGFMFPNAIPRLAEAIRDFGTSCCYYFFGLFSENPAACPIEPTVLNYQAWEFTESPWEPLRLFPWTWEEFKVLWGEYWSLWATWENFENYWWSLSSLLEIISKVLIIALTIYIPYFVISKLKKKPQSDSEDLRINEDSKPLALFKKFQFGVIYPVVDWIKGYIEFLRENPRIYKTWLFLWCLYFNVISIGVAFIAYYLYFIVGFDVLSIYTQVIKLLLDLSPMVRFLPGIVWFIAAFFVLNYLAKEAGYKNLEHCERCNRGFLNERGVVTVIYGNMGTGKTRMLTSLALSAEKQLRDQALEILLETDMKFPNFPWVNLRNEVKRKMENHEFVDVFSIRRWARSLRSNCNYLTANKLWAWFARKIRAGKARDPLFEYDVMHYRTTYNDNLTVTDIFDAINDYAQAYFVYSIQTSLILSNYSIRVDYDVTDNGHFPLYNDDFFRRKPEYQSMYSKYCHILDFDMLRLGKRMLEDNPNRNALGFGVYVISEIDKERKNELQIRKQKSGKKKVKAKEGEDVEEQEECTQDNDLCNACIKMIRHATVIANRVFVKILCDLQRPEDWGAGGREVGEVVFIESKGDKAPVLPVYSPYWLLSFGSFFYSKFLNFNLKYIGERSDNTLFMYLLKNGAAAFGAYKDRTEKLFGCQPFKLEVESGRMDGKVLNRVFYGMDKKDFSARYCTDAMSSIFDLPNAVSIAQIVEYADILATKAERDKQNSHFQKDIDRATAA